MGRQLLTILIVFGAVMLLMRTCAPKGDLPPEPEVHSADIPGDVATLRHEASGTVVQLAKDGGVVSVKRGDTMVVHPVAPFRRPFHLVLVKGRRKEALLGEEWTRSEVEGGWRFECAFDDARIRKTVRLVEGGLQLRLEVSGDAGVSGLWLTAASGITLAGVEDAGQAGAYWQLNGGAAQLRTFRELLDTRAQERAARLRKMKEGEKGADRLPHAEQVNLAATDKVDWFGLLGRDAYLAMRGLPPTSRLKLDVFQIEGVGGRSDEIEAWLDLVASQGAYDETFTLAWGERSDLVGSLFAGEQFREARSYELENDTFRIVFSDRGACITEMWLKSYSTVAGEKPARDNWVPILHAGVSQGERALTLRAERDIGTNPATAVWEVDQPDKQTIRFTLATPRGWRFTKTVTLPEPGRYDLGVDVGIRRPDDSAAKQAKFSLVGPAGVYIADADRGIVGADRPAGFLLERSGGDDDDMVIDELSEGETLYHQYGANRRGLLRAVAVRGAYFVCALITEDREDREGRLLGSVTGAQVSGIDLDREIERPDGTTSRKNMLGRLDLEVALDQGVGREQFRFYAGPNRLEDLRVLQLEDAVDFGVFAVIGRFLMWIMKLFQSLIGSYGVGIILMTVVVRACLLPISYRTQLGMSRYQKRLAKIKPILTELEAKYKKSPQKLQQERMRIMREHKVGFPLGCLTMLLQIPIWFALFQALRVEFSLRHQSFLWAPDLSMPDHAAALPFWPHWLNVFPILMLVLWSLQQRMAPTPGGDDPQVRMQMKMMKFMPYMFFFLLYNYAAALSVYMCVSSGWGILESKYVRKAITQQD